jgi:glycosyltransferase involved in cell wall biosynthesis
MRVGILTSGVVWAPGGSYRVMYEYANRLVQKSHDVHIVYPILVDANVRTPIRFVQFTRSLFKSTGQIAAWFPLHPRIRKHKVIGVQARPFLPLPEVDVWLGMLPLPHIIYWLKLTKKPFTIFVQHPKEITYAVNSQVPLIAVSKFIFEHLSLYGIERLFLVQNGVDLSIFYPKHPIEDRPKTVGMTYVPKGFKDPYTGLEALHRVKQVKPDVEIILFGPTRKPPKVQIPITFYSRVPAEKVADIYNRSAIFVSSSRSEGFCLPVLEAMACGCAVVTTDSGGIRDFVKHGENALVVPPGDVQAIADTVLYLLDNSDLREQLAKNGIETAKYMTWDASVEQLERILREIA